MCSMMALDGMTHPRARRGPPNEDDATPAHRGLSPLRPGPGRLRGPGERLRVDPKVVQADLARSAVTTGEPSWETRNVLFEHGPLRCLRGAPGGRPGRAAPDHGRRQAGSRPALRPRRAGLPPRAGRGRSPSTSWPRPSTPTRSSSRKGPGRRRGASTRACGSRRTCTTGRSREAFASEDGAEVVPRGRRVHAAVRADRGRLRSGRPAGRKPGAVWVHSGRGAEGGRPGDAVSLAGPRRPARRVDPAHRSLDAGPDLVAPRLKVPADRPPPHPRGPPGPRAGTAAHGRARASPGLGRGVGLDRRRAGAARERADGGPGATPSPASRSSSSRRSGSWAGSPVLERPPLVSTHPVQARAHPGRLRARHGVERGPLGRDVQPSPGRPRDPEPLPVLVLPVRFRRPRRAVRAAAARGADRRRWRTSTPRARTRPSAGWC